ncbi:MAG: hypothetical protein BGO31_13955 [Bacteroidetes bacterium 43-16]|nr:MAG: hypothetical protein BGO31_13955 [Bacteroidetes bacterium 43-16]
MKHHYFLFVFYFFLSSCTHSSEQKASRQSAEKTTLTGNNTRHIIYLHGRIIELQGKAAFSEEHGKYELDSILNALAAGGAIVHCELRPENTEVKTYAQKVSFSIDSLIHAGIPATNITIIGASKGALIAATTSSINPQPLNYVLMGGNNTTIQQQNDWHFHGRILCIYDPSDTIAGSNYDYWKQRSPEAIAFEQVQLKENLGHGFLYRPLAAWVLPALKWSRNESL